LGGNVLAVFDVVSLFQDQAEEYSPEANEYVSDDLICFVVVRLFCSFGS
jgi:hypothetical protein